jgi:hypothetical protein
LLKWPTLIDRYPTKIIDDDEGNDSGIDLDTIVDNLENSSPQGVQGYHHVDSKIYSLIKDKSRHISSKEFRGLKSIENIKDRYKIGKFLGQG